MIAALVCFWVLLVIGREELGFKGVAIAMGVWIALLVGWLITGIAPILWMSATALLDVVLLLIVFGSDIKLR